MAKRLIISVLCAHKEEGAIFNFHHPVRDHGAFHGIERLKPRASLTFATARVVDSKASRSELNLTANTHFRRAGERIDAQPDK
jgi:hypothetical protein